MSDVSKFQKFEAVTIHRSQIKNAAYNPRKIGSAEQKALRKSLKHFGLVETIVWNERTGNLVGGHQRISQLDFLEGTQDYSLTVSKVNIDEKTEKELNIALNNHSMQGEYDFEMVKMLLPDIEIGNTGFTEYDLSIIGVDSVLDKKPEKERAKASIEELKEIKEKSKQKNVSTGENYIVLTFEDPEAKEDFMQRLGYEPDDRYISGEILSKRISFNEE